MWSTTGFCPWTASINNEKKREKGNLCSALLPHKVKAQGTLQQGQQHLHTTQYSITLGINVVEQICERRVLGVTLDELHEELKWQSHIDNVCKQLAQNSFLLGQLKQYVSIDCC